MLTPELAAKIEEALAHHPRDGTWEKLCIAGVRLGAAFAAFDKALADYVAAHPNRPGGEQMEVQR